MILNTEAFQPASIGSGERRQKHSLDPGLFVINVPEELMQCLGLVETLLAMSCQSTHSVHGGWWLLVHWMGKN